MSTDLKVSSYVSVRDGCPMRTQFNGDDNAEFSFGSERDPFIVAFEIEALREFLQLGSDALQAIDAQAAAAQAKSALERP